MLVDFVTELGPWAWLLLGLVLLCLELVVPGVFMMWFGTAALIIGGISIMPFTDVSWWPWQAQVVAFLALSVILAVAGSWWMRDPDASKPGDDQPLNDRAAQLRGRTATLVDPIENGIGRIRLGDTMWRVAGPEMGAGTKVRITGANAETLTVEAA